MNFTRYDAIAIGVLVAVALVSYVRTVTQWFLWDDPQLLFGVVSHDLWRFFADPATWRTQSSTNFVPLLLAEFAADYALFGLDSRPYYIHHLAVVVAAAVVFYLYLRRFCSEASAVAAAATLLLSAPSFAVGSLLSNRHYAEGLLFSLLVLILVEKPGVLRRALAAFFFLLACLSKEVFVPLPALIVMMSFVRGRPFRAVVRQAVPFVGVLAVYIPWRLWMLGKLGGYGAPRTLEEVAALPAQVFRASVGQSAAAGALLALALASLVLVNVHRLRAMGLLGIGCIFFLLPPLLALTVMDERYVFVATVTMIALAAVSIDVPRRTVARLAFFLFCAVLTFAGLDFRRRHSDSLDLMKREGMYLWTMPQGARPLLATSNGWYAEGVRWMRRFGKEEEPPRALGSVHAMVVERVSPSEVVTYDISPRKLAGLYRRTADSQAPSLPLGIDVERESEVFTWRLRGAPGSVFYFLPEPQLEMIPIGRTSWLRLPSRLRAPTFDTDPDAAFFRVMVVSHGSWRISPSLRFPRPGERVEWSGR